MARVPFGAFSVSSSTRCRTKAFARQTKDTVLPFVLVNTHAQIREIVTVSACRVMVRVSVASPFPPLFRGGSHVSLLPIAFFLSTPDEMFRVELIRFSVCLSYMVDFVFI